MTFQIQPKLRLTKSLDQFWLFLNRAYFLLLLNTNWFLSILKIKLHNRFSTLEEAVIRANATPYGLGAGIWTKDIRQSDYAMRRIKAGMVNLPISPQFIRL